MSTKQGTYAEGMREWIETREEEAKEITGTVRQKRYMEDVADLQRWQEEQAATSKPAVKVSLQYRVGLVEFSDMLDAIDHAAACGGVVHMKGMRSPIWRPEYR